MLWLICFRVFFVLFFFLSVALCIFLASYQCTELSHGACCHGAHNGYSSRHLWKHRPTNITRVGCVPDLPFKTTGVCILLQKMEHFPDWFLLKNSIAFWLYRSKLQKQVRFQWTWWYLGCWKPRGVLEVRSQKFSICAVFYRPENGAVKLYIHVRIYFKHAVGIICILIKGHPLFILLGTFLQSCTQSHRGSIVTCDFGGVVTVVVLRMGWRKTNKNPDSHSVLCVLRCFSAHHGCQEWLSYNTKYVSGQNLSQLLLTGWFSVCFYFLHLFVWYENPTILKNKIEE